jgi:hypothetical protein
MRACKVFWLSLVTLGACGYPVGQADKAARPPREHNPCTGEPSLIVSPEILKYDEGARAAWMAYGITKLGVLRGQVSGLSARRASDYGIELEAHTTMLSVWKHRRAEGAAPDAYLDTLMDVERAGFLEEYVLISFGEPGWTLPASALASLDWTGFFAWAKSHLGKHRPKMLAQACSRTAPLPGPAPGSDLPDPVTLSPERRPCQQLRSPLSAAGTRWGAIERQLRAKPIILSTTTSPVPSLRYVADYRADYPNGVTFVPTRVASVLFYGGFCAIEAGDFPAAEHALQAAARVAPFDAGIHLELAHALVTQKKLADAASEVELGLRFAAGKCQTGLAWRKKGFVLFEQGKLVDAYRAYQKSLEFDPASQIAVNEMLLLAKTLTRSGGVPSDIKGFVPPPSQGSTTRCTDQ